MSEMTFHMFFKPFVIKTGKEDYDELEKCMGGVFAEIQELAEKGFNFAGNLIFVEW